MKTLKLLLSLSILLCASNLLTAQTGPYEGFNYQGIARDASGNPVANQSIGVKIDLLYAVGFVYAETHSTTTDARGLFTLKVGTGTPIVPNFYESFDAIDWSGELNWAMLVSADFSGGMNYQPIGNPENLISVPFAKAAEVAKATEGLLDGAFTVDTVNKIIHSDPNYKVGIGTSAPSDEFEVDGISRMESLFIGDGITHDNTGARDLIIKRNPAQQVWLSLQDEDSGVNEWEFRGNNSGDLRFMAGFDERLTFKQDGRVGINVQNPIAKFDVDGDVRIRSYLNLDEGIYWSGWDMIGTPGSFVINENNVGPVMSVVPGGNMAVGPNTPAAGAALDVQSTTGAFMPPRLSTAQRDALTPLPGMMIFNTDAGIFQGYGGFENGAFASNTENSASSSASSPNCGLGCVDGRQAYQTFEVAVPTQVDSIRFHVASWTSDGTPAWSYNFTIAEGSPDNPVGGTEVNANGFAFGGSPGPSPSGSVTISFGTPYQLMPGVQYHFSVASGYGFTAALEASADGAGTYGNGEQWERVATGSNQSTPPTITFNQLTSDLRFEIYSGETVAGWSDLR